MLLAYDGSAAAKRALEHAATLVGARKEVAVVNVIPVQSVSSRLVTVSDDERARQEEILHEAETLLAGKGVGATLIPAVGDPLTEIIAAADSTNADVVVVGRGNGRRRILHGSFSSRLVRATNRDVLVVH